jgi:hypothetical protein
MDLGEFLTVEEFSSAIKNLLDVEESNFAFEIDNDLEHAIAVSNTCEVLMYEISSKVSELSDLSPPESLTLRMAIVGGMTIQKWASDIILKLKSNAKPSDPE